MNEDVFDELFCMGTVITQRIIGKNAKVVLNESVEELKKIEKLMSYFDSESDVYKINKNAGISKVNVNDETSFVIQKSLEYSKLTNGAFDITAGVLSNLWRESTKIKEVPDSKIIKEGKKLVGYKDIVIDSSSVFLKKIGQSIDLGAIAKGYAADKVIEIYKKNGIKSAFVNLGGNVYVLGKKQDDTPWKIGIQNPRGMTSDIIGYLQVNDKTVVTSGDYQRYFIKDGVRYHHIINSKTGYPEDSGITSVTVISNNSMKADAVSTAMFVLGVKKTLKLFNKLDNIAIIVISSNDKIYISKNIENNFTLLNKNLDVSYI